MKLIFLLFSITIFLKDVHAQTFAEWFSQGKTQKKYLLAQIAALQVYEGYLKDGYKIAKTGLNVVNDVKHGEFNLHNAFFTSLKTVSPTVRGYGRVAEIVSMQLALVKSANQIEKQAQASTSFDEDELHYLQKIFSAITDGCLEDVLALTNIITSGKLELTEDQRIARINHLYDSVKDKYAFVQSFGGDINAQTVIRKHDKQENYLR